VFGWWIRSGSVRKHSVYRTPGPQVWQEVKVVLGDLGRVACRRHSVGVLQGALSGAAPVVW
jgi:hypothetical protein